MNKLFVWGRLSVRSYKPANRKRFVFWMCLFLGTFSRYRKTDFGSVISVKSTLQSLNFTSVQI